MINSFDTEVAIDVGINAAILYQNIHYWCMHNEANRINEHDGLYWTYNSMKAFAELFPYLSEAQVRQALKVLEQKGYIKTGYFNKQAYDRTKWYADLRLQSEESLDSICYPSQMDMIQETNGFDTDSEPIPDNNSNNNPNIKTNIKEKSEVLSAEEVMFEEFWKAYPQCFRKVNKKGCKTKFLKIEHLKEIFPDIIDSLEMQKKSKQWKEQEGQFIPAPLTWINQERWTMKDPRNEIQTKIDEAVEETYKQFLF